MMAQFIPEIYNNFYHNILGYFCGVTGSLRGGVEYLGGMEVSSMEPPNRPPPRSPARPGQPQPHPPLLHPPRISYILTTLDGARGLVDGPCDIDASSSCAVMRWSSPIRRKTNLAI